MSARKLHRRKLNLPLQRIQVGIHTLRPRCNRIGGKRAIQTGRRTERYPDIQAVPVVIIDLGKQGELPLCNVCRKADLLIRRKISLLHIRIDLVPAFSLFEQLHRNLGRPDSRERSPRQILTGRIRQKRIQILFQPVLRLRAV